MNSGLERIWKEAVVALFQVLSRHLPGWTEENHKKPQTGQPVFEPRYKPRNPKHEAAVTSCSRILNKCSC
jgi:hypothetical protein